MPIGVSATGEHFWITENGDVMPLETHYRQQQASGAAQRAIAQDTSPLMAGVIGADAAYGNMLTNAGLREREGDPRALDTLREAHPVATRVGEWGANMMVPTGGGFGPLGVANRIMQESALGYLQRGEHESGLFGALSGGIGGMAGEMATRVLNRLVGAMSLPVRESNIPPGGAERAARELQTRYGVETTPGERSGNTMQKTAESYFDAGLMSGNRLARKEADTGALLNDSVARALGLDDAQVQALRGQVTPEVVAQAKREAAQELNDIYPQLPKIHLVGDNAADFHSNVLSNKNLRQLINADRRKAGGRFPKKPLPVWSGEGRPPTIELSGKEVGRVRSQLSSMAESAQEWADVENAVRLRNALDEQVMDNAGAPVARRYAQARERYGIAATLDNGSIATADGIKRADMIAKRLNEQWPEGSQFNPAIDELKDVSNTLWAYRPVKRNIDTSASGVALQNPAMAPAKRLLQEVYYSNQGANAQRILGDYAASIPAVRPLGGGPLAVGRGVGRGLLQGDTSGGGGF